MTVRAFVSGASARLHGTDFDAAFGQNRLRSAERPAPDGIVEIGRGRVQAGDACVDDRARAIDAREEGRGEVGAGRRHAPPGGFENRVALGVLHPDESPVAFMALLEVAHASRERVAGRDLRAIAGDKDSADPANTVRAQRGRAEGRPHLSAGRRASTVHVDLLSLAAVDLRACLRQLVSTFGQELEFRLLLRDASRYEVVVRGAGV